MKKVKFEFDIPEWVLAIIYIIGCGVIGVLFGAIVSLLI